MQGPEAGIAEATPCNDVVTLRRFAVLVGLLVGPPACGGDRERGERITAWQDELFGILPSVSNDHGLV